MKQEKITPPVIAMHDQSSRREPPIIAEWQEKGSSNRKEDKRDMAPVYGFNKSREESK